MRVFAVVDLIFSVALACCARVWGRWLAQVLWADVRGTFRSAAHNARAPDAALGLPCALPYDKGAFCAACPCSRSSGTDGQVPRKGRWRCAL